MTIRAYAAGQRGAAFQTFQYEPDALPMDWVEVAVEHCGVCHSDLSMLDNEWRNSTYPLVPGHEIVGRVVAAGAAVKTPTVGQRVGIGWYSASCGQCRTCLSGDHHFCPSRRGTIVGNHGGFAERVRCAALWATPLPEGLDASTAGPLFCGGITVFSPLVEFNVRPTDRVAVVGIGGLGHMAVQFAKHWGCEVTALTSTAAKSAEARGFGAHDVVAGADEAAWKRLAGRFDFILVTVNVPLPWSAVLGALSPRGRLHVVGAVLEPMAIAAFSLIGDRRAVSGSPVGNPADTATMLDFCARHAIKPQVERYPMSRVNAAFDHLRAGKARYRIVLDADFEPKR
jgi:uncharacterized zinc-type alcohol dehydrogenase-like protein